MPKIRAITSTYHQTIITKIINASMLTSVALKMEAANIIAKIQRDLSGRKDA